MKAPKKNAHVISPVPSTAAAGIGYRNIGVHAIRDRYGNSFLRQPRLEKPLEEQKLNVRESAENYPPIAPMQTVAVDCGENGLFSADEFRALSAPGSMELVSPEEVAEVAIQELLGVPTGHNVLTAVAGAVLPPGYRAGTMRPLSNQLLDDLLEQTSVDAAVKHDLDASAPLNQTTTTIPSIATGQLGPQLAKYLFEAHLLKLYHKGDQGLALLAHCDPVALSKQLSHEIRQTLQHPTPATGRITIESLTRLVTTIGVPIVLDDESLVRGPNITDPEPRGTQADVAITSPTDLNVYARRGWVDVRAPNLQLWKDRARHILSEPPNSAVDTSSLTGLHYYNNGSNEIDPAAISSWILAGELHGHRDVETVNELTNADTKGGGDSDDVLPESA